MNIQNNNNVNFEARRILNVRKVLQNGADEVIDVFALGREDKKFVARCNAALQDTDRVVVTQSSANINKFDSSADKGYKQFFSDFLFRLKDKKPIYVQNFDDVHCYIAIKDGEMISGIAEISDAEFPVASLDRLIFPKKDKSLEDGFLYGILTGLRNVFKKYGQSGLCGLNRKMSKKINEDEFLKLGNFGYLQSSIKMRNKDLEIDGVKDSHQYDLEDFLGIKDIETEIME